MYAPLIRSATGLRRYRLGTYLAGLVGDIESAGEVRYLYVLRVIKEGEQSPCLYVASEVNEMASRLGGGSHFLGVFDAEGHSNLGASDDWADLERFEVRALAVAAERLGVTEAPERVE